MDATRDEAAVPEVEIRRHEYYWRGFVRVMTWSAVGIGILLLGMAFFLVD